MSADLSRNESGIAILSKGCTCGHDHETMRGERVELCLECSCSELVNRCQNCGAETPITGLNETRVDGRLYDVCSERCRAQIDYAIKLKAREAVA